MAPTYLPVYAPADLPVYEHTTPSTPSSPSTPCTAYAPRGEFTFKSDHLRLFLPCPTPKACTRIPAYGFNGVVEGIIQVRKKCNHVVRLTVTLEGAISISVPQGGRVPIADLTSKPVLSLPKVVLYESHGGSDGTLQGEYAFSIPFPTYVAGGTNYLPPSYTIYHVAASVSVDYAIKIQIIRKGFFRRGEVLSVPILYLPRTRPSVSPLTELPRTLAADHNYRIKTVVVSSKASDDYVPIAQLILPSPTKFTSGDIIPLAVMLKNTKHPALPQLWSERIKIQFVKHSRIWVGEKTRALSVKENLLGDAELLGLDNSVEGVSASRWAVKIRSSSGRTVMSWRVNGVVEVLYLIRLTIHPPHCQKMDTLKHDEFVDVTTDPYIEEVEDETFPALGLINVTEGAPACEL